MDETPEWMKEACEVLKRDLEGVTTQVLFGAMTRKIEELQEQLSKANQHLAAYEEMLVGVGRAISTLSFDKSMSEIVMD